MIAIRHAKPVDLSTVNECAQEAFGFYLNRMDHEPARMNADFERQISAGRTYVAELDQRFAGYIVIHQQSDHVLVDHIAVLPAMSGKGVGSQLLAHAEQMARDWHKPRVQLYTNALMHENLCWYAWLGYSKIGRRVEQGFDRVYFSKDVSVHLRRAMSSDVAILYAWDAKPHIRKAVSNSGAVAFEADWAQEIAGMDGTCEFLIAEVGGKPIGAIQLIDPALEPTHYWGNVEPNLRAIDIWIGEEDYLAKGFGTIMMTFAINRCFSSDAITAIIIDPLYNNLGAHRFYKRLGFEFVERRQFDEDSDCAVFRLQRAVWESVSLQLTRQ